MYTLMYTKKRPCGKDRFEFLYLISVQFVRTVN